MYIYVLYLMHAICCMDPNSTHIQEMYSMCSTYFVYLSVCVCCVVYIQGEDGY